MYRREGNRELIKEEIGEWISKKKSIYISIKKNKDRNRKKENEEKKTE